MSSSISSSEVPAEALAWKQWIAIFVAWLLLGFGGLYSLVLFLDPYDTGRFAVFKINGIVDESPRTAVASRGRDPRFDAAIVGNSTGQLLAPKQLSQLTGLDFVQLTIPGTGPREQFMTMRWFARHHPRISALVIVTDEAWCTHDPSFPIFNPFPFWLYSDGMLEYLGGVFQRQALDRASRRVLLALGMRSPTEPTGYVDYEVGRTWNFHPDLTARPEASQRQHADSEQSFPAIDKLRNLMQSLPETPVVLVMPPAFFTLIPQPGSAAARHVALCKAALAAAVADRPRSGFLDFLSDNAVTRDPENFMDHKHYRASIARDIEAQIAARLRLGHEGL
jgi:hypothetical protein